LKEAYHSYRQVKKEAGGARLAFLEDLAQAQAEEGNVSAEGLLKAFIHREQARSTSRKIKVMMRGTQLSSVLDHVIGPDGRAVNDQQGMCRILAEENRKRFLQSFHTPFMCNQDLVRDFGRLGLDPETDAVLQGQYTIPLSCPNGVRLFLEQMERPVGVQMVSSRIST